MLSPLQQWFCDTCGEVIEKPEDGYVIWRDRDNGFEGDFRIIHQSRCDNKSFGCSAPVTDFLGIEGMNKLLSFLSHGQIRANKGLSSDTRIKRMDEFVDFFRRMQTPYYEEARQYFDKAELWQDFGDTNEIYPYQVGILQNIIRQYSGGSDK